MTELRQRMIDAMVQRGFAYVTRHPMGCRIGYRIYGARGEDECGLVPVLQARQTAPALLQRDSKITDSMRLGRMACAGTLKARS